MALGPKEKASPAVVEKYIKGIDFPAGKQDLIDYAEDNNAPAEVLAVLNRLPDKDYKGAADVAKGIAQIE